MKHGVQVGVARLHTERTTGRLVLSSTLAFIALLLSATEIFGVDLAVLLGINGALGRRARV